MKKVHLVNLIDANGESFIFGCASTPEKAQKMIELYKTEEKYKDCTFKITFCNVDTVILGDNQERALTDDFTTDDFEKTEDNPRGNPDYFKMFYSPYQADEANDFQKEKGWKMIWGSDSHGLNGDTFIVYRSVDDLPKYLRDYAREEEQKRDKTAIQQYANKYKADKSSSDKER